MNRKLMFGALIALGVGVVLGFKRKGEKKAAEAGPKEETITSTGPTVAESQTPPRVSTPAPELPATPSVGVKTVGPEYAAPQGGEAPGAVFPKSALSSYQTKRGEPWSAIAIALYGDYRWWPLLWDLNRADFPSPDKGLSGTIVVLAKASLPVEKKASYFARAAEHARVWAAHKKTSGYGKTLPAMPDSVTTPTR